MSSRDAHVLNEDGELVPAETRRGVERPQAVGEVVATRLSSWSPSPCPRLSFTVLKSSRSMKSTARWEPVWPMRARACSSRSWNSALLASPVRESWKARYSSSSSSRMRSVTSRKLQTRPTMVAVHRLRPRGQLERRARP